MYSIINIVKADDPDCDYRAQWILILKKGLNYIYLINW